VIRQAGEHLQWLLKNTAPPVHSAYQAPFSGILPQIYKMNMAKRRAVKFGIGSVAEVPAASPPPWVHRCDPTYTTEGVLGNARNRAVPYNSHRMAPIPAGCQVVRPS
jgi:hypothetical protein